MIQGGEVRYVVYIGGVQQAQAGLNQMEQSANRAERGITNLNGALRTMSGALGVGFGAHALVSFAKDAVQSAADYEGAMKRIVFASSSMEEGQKNLAFIRAEVDKFRIPLQEATDDYGKFLAMLAGSDIAGDQVRELHDQILTIAKIKGLDAGQLSAGVMNLGKMLEAGGMDARHLRPLEMQLSGIGQYIANLMGTTVHGLAEMRNKGLLSAADPKILLEAVKRQAADLEKFLPESLTTLQSGLNDVSNAWLEFKNNLILENKAEIIDLFKGMQDGVKYLSEHKEDIRSIAHFVVTAAKAWVGYHAAMLLVNTANSTYRAFTQGYAGQSAAIVSAAETQAVAFNSLAMAMERVAFATEAMAGASLTGIRGLGTLGIPLAGAGAATAASAEAGALAGVSVVSGALLVALAAGSIVAITEAMRGEAASNTGRVLSPGTGFYDAQFLGRNYTDTLGYNITPAGDTTYNTRMRYGVYSSAMGGNQWDKLSPGMQAKVIQSATKKPESDNSFKIKPPTDKVTGQRVVTYNISIKEINGIKENTVNEGGKMNEEDFAERMKQVILSTLRDSHIDYR